MLPHRLITVVCFETVLLRLTLAWDQTLVSNVSLSGKFGFRLWSQTRVQCHFTFCNSEVLDWIFFCDEHVQVWNVLCDSAAVMLVSCFAVWNNKLSSLLESWEKCSMTMTIHWRSWRNCWLICNVVALRNISNSLSLSLPFPLPNFTPLCR